jgi:DNA-binding beta-propeller fold protein YncE
MLPIVDPARVVSNWPDDASRFDFGLVSTLATDSQNRVFVLCRTPKPAMHVFTAAGAAIGPWTAHAFVQPHGLWIAPDDRVLVTDTGDHTVRIFDRDGVLLQTLGTPGVAGAPGEPFNAPTRAVLGPTGDLFVSDGYGQARVHRFAPDGRLIRSWGEPGSGPGQFDTPHSVWVDEEEGVFVVDRGNARVQVFDGEGQFRFEWGGFRFPHDIFITHQGLVVVTDCAPRVEGDATPYHQTMWPTPIRLFAKSGELLGSTGRSGDGAGEFLDCPHAIWIDRAGDIYVSEVVTHNRLQKFRGIRSADEAR